MKKIKQIVFKIFKSKNIKFQLNINEWKGKKLNKQSKYRKKAFC